MKIFISGSVFFILTTLIGWISTFIGHGSPSGFREGITTARRSVTGQVLEDKYGSRNIPMRRARNGRIQFERALMIAKHPGDSSELREASWGAI